MGRVNCERGKSEYESLRNARMLQNQARLESLGILNKVSQLRQQQASAQTKKSPRPYHKRVYGLNPLRRSKRINTSAAATTTTTAFITSLSVNQLPSRRSQHLRGSSTPTSSPKLVDKYKLSKADLARIAREAKAQTSNNQGDTVARRPPVENPAKKKARLNTPQPAPEVQASGSVCDQPCGGPIQQTEVWKSVHAEGQEVGDHATPKRTRRKSGSRSKTVAEESTPAEEDDAANMGDPEDADELADLTFMENNLSFDSYFEDPVSNNGRTVANYVMKNNLGAASWSYVLLRKYEEAVKAVTARSKRVRTLVAENKELVATMEQQEKDLANANICPRLAREMTEELEKLRAEKANYEKQLLEAETRHAEALSTQKTSLLADFETKKKSLEATFSKSLAESDEKKAVAEKKVSELTKELAKVKSEAAHTAENLAALEKGYNLECVKQYTEGFNSAKAQVQFLFPNADLSPMGKWKEVTANGLEGDASEDEADEVMVDGDANQETQA